MVDKYLCPQCGADDVRKVEMIWEEPEGGYHADTKEGTSEDAPMSYPAEHRLVYLATIRRTPGGNPSEENLDALSPVCMDAIERALQKMKKKMENNGTEGK